MSDGLKAQHRAAIIATLAANDRVEQAVLFGSRAMGTNTVTSDVDIALFGQQLTLTDQASLAAACEELPMAQSVDLVLHSTIDNPALVQHIRSHGVEWYRRGGGSDRPSGVAIEKPQEVAAHGGWSVLALRDAGVQLIDCVHKTPAAQEDGYPYVGIPQMKDGWIDFDSARKISREDFVEWTRKAKPQLHDVLLSRRTNPGVTAIDRTGTNFALGQNLVLLRADGHQVDPPFLKWLVRTPTWWKQINKFMNVGAVFNSLKCADIPNFKLPIPPIKDQQQIGSFLDAIDMKIDLNRRMDETLEAMARALFKSWFVDFDPVRAKAEGRPTGLPDEISALFPDSFEDSELGEIPRGWGVKVLKEVTYVLSRGISPKYCEDGGVKVINQRCIRNGTVDFTKSRRHDPSLKNIEGRTIKKFDTLINSTGVGTLGRVATTPELDVSQVIVDSHVTVVRGETEENSFYLSLLLLCKQKEIEAMGEGSTGQTELSRSILGSMSIILPQKELIKSFHKCACDFHEKKWLNEKSSTFHAQLRDTVLPKLLSGEICVGETEKIMEVVA